MWYKLFKYYQEFKRKRASRWGRRIYNTSQIKVGKGLKCNSIPNLLVTDKAQIQMGENVIIMDNVEIRAHGNSKIIIGDGCKIDDGVRIIAANDSVVQIGNKSKVGFHSVLNGGGGIRIGDNTSLYGFVYIQSSSHNFKGDSPTNQQGFSHGSVSIGSNVLLGANSVILPDVLIEDDCLIGANAVVTKKVENNSISIGVPARHHSKMK